MAKMAGGCYCGKLRYSTDADPIFTGVCHCTSCQKLTGGAFSIVVAVPTPALTVTGESKRFDSKGDSGLGTHYRFCPNCGSPVLDDADALPNVTMIRAGSLDDTSALKPTMQIYCDSKQPWVALGGEMTSFPKMPSPN
jgi:hypothetical protein